MPRGKEACAPQLLKPAHLQPTTREPTTVRSWCRRVATVLCSWRKPVLSNEDPAQPPKINKYSEKLTKDVGSDTISDSELSCRTTNWSLRIDWWEPLHTLELEVPCHSSTAMPLWLQKKTGQIYVYALLFLWRVASGLSQEGSGTWDKSSQSVIHRCVA